jgi:phenylpyruvate tautomerase PptA (4-oxalocrotonate tautomerase family)
MPIVRVDIPAGHADSKKDEIRDGIKRRSTDVLDPGQKGRHPETRKWIYVSITEAYGKLGDGLPTVTIDTRPGRTQEQKASWRGRSATSSSRRSERATSTCCCARSRPATTSAAARRCRSGAGITA